MKKQHMLFMLPARDDDWRSHLLFLRATITTCSPSMTLHYMWYMNTYVRMHACVYTCFLCIYGIYIHTLCVCISFSIFIFFLWMYMYVYIGVCCTCIYFLCVGVYKSTFVCFLAYTWIILIMPPPPIFSIFLCDILCITYIESIMFLIYDTWHISYDICCGLRILYNV